MLRNFTKRRRLAVLLAVVVPDVPAVAVALVVPDAAAVAVALAVSVCAETSCAQAITAMAHTTAHTVVELDRRINTGLRCCAGV